MRTDDKLKPIIIFLVAFVAVGVIFLWMSDMDYFNVSSVRVDTDKSVVPDTMMDLCEQYVGGNILRFTKKAIAENVMSLGYVSDVEVVKVYPDTLVVSATLNDYDVRVHTESPEKYYLAGGELIEVSKETWDIYSYIPDVELIPTYASMLSSWGIDNGFMQMARLVVAMYGENLITSINYDNNNTGYFGRLVLVLDSLSATVTVTEPVEPQRLIEALGIVESRQSGSDAMVRYELTSTSLSW